MKLHLTLQPVDAGRKIRDVLSEAFPLSASALRWLRYHSRISLDGTVYKISDLIPPGSQELSVETDSPAPSAQKPDHLDIRFEDEFLLVIWKPAGLRVHSSGPSDSQDSLCARVQAWLQTDTIYPVGRLDQEVAGFMLFGKNYLSASMLETQRSRGRLHKKYLALCHGTWLTPSGTISAPIARTDTFNRYMVSPEGKEAISHYRVLRNFLNFSLVEVWIDTGRTHQIRLHLKDAGHPIVSDGYYGIDSLTDTCQLYAYHLELEHPVTGQPLVFERFPDFSWLADRPERKTGLCG